MNDKAITLMTRYVLLLIICLATAIHCHSQSRAELKSDTAYYQGQKIFNGKKLNLSYGSGQNKDFVFVQFLTIGGGFNHVAAKWSKYELVVTDLLNQKGKILIKGKFTEKGLGLMGQKLIIDVEGAIDNKEILIP